MEIASTMQRLLQPGGGHAPVPFVTIEYVPTNKCLVPCDARAFLDHMHALGYAWYDPIPRASAPVRLADVDANVGREWWFAHSTAVLPAGWLPQVVG